MEVQMARPGMGLRGGRDGRLSERRKEAIAGYLYIAPFFILFMVFGLFPIGFSFYLAFQKWNGLGTLQFVGLDNFRFILEDSLFWRSVTNTLILGVMGTLPQILVGIPLAFVLHQGWLRFRSFFRMAIFMPYITSTVAVAITFGVMFSDLPEGLANVGLSWLGMEPVHWRTSEWGSKIAISAMLFWRWLGYNTVIFLAGLQRIPQDLYEAAQMDGASAWQQFRYITLPLLQPVIVFVVFLSTVGAWQLFVEPFLFYGKIGSVREEGMTIVVYLWREAFANSAFGPASAAAVVLFFIIAFSAWANMLVSKRLNG